MIWVTVLGEILEGDLGRRWGGAGIWGDIIWKIFWDFSTMIGNLWNISNDFGKILGGDWGGRGGILGDIIREIFGISVR